jgi:uncharacterized membrane protein
MRIPQQSPFTIYVRALLGLSAVSLLSFGLGVLRGNGLSDWYLIWNLFLAWVPMVLAYVLIRQLRNKAWSSWTGIGLTLAWILFLPNSFYMVSDYIHLQDMARSSVLFDALTFTLFITNGLILGYTSMYLVQAAMRERGVRRLHCELFAAALLLLCSFAIYLGRDLRWNSWDVLLSPAGIIFDVSERILDPLAHPLAFSTTFLFFVFLAGLYWVLAHMVHALGAYARSRKHWS